MLHTTLEPKRKQIRWWQNKRGPKGTSVNSKQGACPKHESNESAVPNLPRMGIPPSHNPSWGMKGTNRSKR